MGSFQILKGLTVLSVFVIIYLLRPMSCRRTAVTSRKDFAQFDHNIAVKCHRKCLLLRLQHKYTHPYQKDCFNFCVNREIEKETRLGSVPGRTYVVIDSNEKLPKNLVLPSRMPHLPKELYDKVNPRLWPVGDCDAFNSFANIDMTMKHAVLPEHVTVTCVNKNKLLVTWKQPEKLRNCSGYQVNYRLGQNFGSGRLHCYEVAENKRAMLIDQSKGFQGQQEIFLAVTALPLPFKCDIKLQKFELCKGKDVLQAPIRERRNINATPSFIILKSGDPVPTDLIMPSIIPKFPGDGNDPFAKYKTNSNCLPPPLTTSSTKYAGKANIKSVGCMKAGNFSKKSFIVYWDLPKDYLKAPFTHFQVIYSITPDNIIPNPRRLGCHQVPKTILSYTVENVDATDTINVLVVPYPTYSNLKENMERFTPCLTTNPPTTRPRTTQSPKPSIRIEVVVGAVVAIVFALAILALLYIYHTRRTPGYTQEPVKQEKIYVSYYPDSKRYHSSLLNLVAKLRRIYSVNLIMDSYCQTEVSELGLARWCQKQMSGSTRILMVISEEYLKICNEWKNGSADMLESNDVDVSRVCSELQYILDQIFERRKNSLLTIVLADVNQSDLPDFLRGMKTFSWPKSSDDENAVVCNICAKEATVTA